MIAQEDFISFSRRENVITKPQSSTLTPIIRQNLQLDQPTIHCEIFLPYFHHNFLLLSRKLFEAVTSELVFGRRSFRISLEAPHILSEVLHCFPQYLHEKSRANTSSLHML
jgi:hypothetical protein